MGRDKCKRGEKRTQAREYQETRLEMEAPEDTVTWWVTMGSGVKLMPVPPLPSYSFLIYKMGRIINNGKIMVRII